MKKIILLLIPIFVLLTEKSIGQNIAITDDDGYTPAASAMLDVKSLTKGFLAPRMTTAQRNAIASPAAGLIVFDTNIGGYYYYNGSSWLNLSSGSASGLLWAYSSPNLYMANSSNYVGIGTSSPYHKLHVYQSVSNINGTDGAFIDIQNSNASTGVMSGIRFTNGYYGTPNTFKGGIFYKDAIAYNRGDIIFANNSWANANDVTAADARMIIKNDGRVQILGDSAVSANDALFHVENSMGDTVFAVYPYGVRIYIGDDQFKATGSRGGFAVGGFSEVKGLTNEFLRVTPDSVRIYIDDEYVAAKANSSRGGFAVGGFSQVKGITNNYLFVQDDSSRVYVSDSLQGFGVQNIQGTGSRIMRLNTDNYYIGHESGIKNSGKYNSTLGYKTAALSQTGDANVFIGYLAGSGNVTGDNNVYIGYKAGEKALGSGNIMIGTEAGKNITSGTSNLLLGFRAGVSLTSGGFNTFLGAGAGSTCQTGNYNTFTGMWAGNACTGDFNSFYGIGSGWYTTTGTENVFMGAYSGLGNSTGNYNVCLGNFSGNSLNGDGNVYLGHSAGYNASGSGNILIGQNAGYSASGSNRLYIENSSSTTPLIYGEFDTDLLRFNGRVIVAGTSLQMLNNPGTGVTPTYYVYQGSSTASTSKQYAFAVHDALWVTSHAWIDGNVTCVLLTQTSDKRLKSNITEIDNPLNKVLSLHGVYYNWNEKMTELPGYSKERQIGFIAQEVEKIAPELVTEDENGTKSVSYSNSSALIIEAIKEQQKIIDELKNELSESKKLNKELRSEIDQIKSALNSSASLK